MTFFNQLKHGYFAEDEISMPIIARFGTGGGNGPVIAYSVGNGQLNQISMSEQCNTLDTMHDKQAILTVEPPKKYLVRRVTPLECERLQGYPDKWTDIAPWTDSKGKKHKDADSPRYVALGNSLALPFWDWLAERICTYYDEPVKMGGLFSGIGGFEYVFKKHGAEIMWCSEVNEFCIAVTKKHFGDEDAGLEGDIDQYI